MKKIVSAVSGLAIFSPMIALAAGEVRITGILGIIDYVRLLLNRAVPILIAFAVVYFLYGVFSYIMASDDDDKRGKAKNVIVYGIILIFVMVSVWGLVNLLVGSFGLENNPIPGPVLPL